MMILALVRNYMPVPPVGARRRLEHRRLRRALLRPRGDARRHRRRRAHRLAVLRRLKPFDVKLHYTDRHRLPAEVEEELGADLPPRRRGDGRRVCDVVTINAPLHPETEHLFDDDADRHDEARRLPDQHRPRQDLRPRRRRARAGERAARRATPATSGSRSRPPADHPWRTMPHHGMTPHISGTSLSAQARYAAGTREILECWFDGRPIREEYLIVDGGAPGRRRRALLQRGRRHRRLRGGGPLDG